MTCRRNQVEGSGNFTANTGTNPHEDEEVYGDE
jgi:hypothetical protein